MPASWRENYFQLARAGICRNLSACGIFAAAFSAEVAGNHQLNEKMSVKCLAQDLSPRIVLSDEGI